MLELLFARSRGISISPCMFSTAALTRLLGHVHVVGRFAIVDYVSRLQICPLNFKCQASALRQDYCKKSEKSFPDVSTCLKALFPTNSSRLWI